jgi:hypothetical protein
MTKNQKIKEIIQKFIKNNASWEDFSIFLKSDIKDLDTFFQITNQRKLRHFDNKLKIYVPGKRFPAISLTGNECELHCEHCNEKYLDGMISIRSNKKLEDFLLNHSKNGGVGVLLSGGCLSDGSVPLLNYLDTVKKVKEKTNLIINTHTGLLHEVTAKKLADAKIDIVSFDLNLDPEIINNIYHLNKEINEYKQAFKLLEQYGLNIIPHICIGLYYGNLHKELQALQFLKESGVKPSLIVFIALIPPKNSKYKFKAPSPYDIGKIIGITRLLFPGTEISLGCMRPRKRFREQIEIYSIKAGITRIEMPSKKSLKRIKETFPEVEYQFYSACCAIPERYEERARMNPSEVKRYSKF